MPHANRPQCAPKSRTAPEWSAVWRALARALWSSVLLLGFALATRPGDATAQTSAPSELAAAQQSDDAAAPSAPADGTRPRIALALSGGAARGLAHVGVLKILEELRVPVHAIAGTSMGAIVGGLYALGFSALEIETFVQRMDWQDLFSDKPNRSQRSFRRNEDDSAEFLDFEFGIERGKIKLPRSLIAGQKFAFAFDSPATHTSGFKSFDSLAIPFRAVATDLRSGEMVVLDRGSLVRAFRASMAVPGFFSPAEVNGRLLVDGGVVRNLPTDVARDMGVDVVIAVDVSEDLGDRSHEQLTSLLGLSLQLTTLIIKVNTDPLLPLADLVLRPDLADVSIIDFARADEAMLAGESVARQSREALQKYSLPDEEYEVFRREHRGVHSPDVVIDAISLVNRSRIDERAIRKRLAVREGQRLDFAQLRRDLVDIYDLGSLESVDFELREPAGQSNASSDNKIRRTLHLTLNEKTYAPNFLRVGLRVGTELRGRTRFQSLSRLTRTEINGLGAEWRNDFRLGPITSVRSEWYQPLEFSRRFFTAIQLDYTNRFQDVYDGRSRAAEYGIQSATGGVDFGMQLKRYGELRTGFVGGWVKTRVRTGISAFPQSEGGQGAWRTRLDVDRFDDADFPRFGDRAVVEMQMSRRALGAETRYDRLQLQATHFHSWGANSFFLGFHGASSLGTTLPPHDEFLLGGFGSFSGLRPEERRGRVLTTARFGVYRPFLRDVDLLGTDVYAGTWVEAGNVWQSNQAVRIREALYAWTIALGADTILGPTYLTYGRTNEGDNTVFLTVGRQIGSD